MPAKAEEVGTAEELLLPHERAPQSAEEAARSLFEAMESEDLDFDDLDQPGEDESDAEPKRQRREEPAESEEDFEDDEEFEELDYEESEDDFEDDEDFEDEEPEGEPDDDSEDANLYEVTLPGGETAQVTLEELTAGYSRTADYTRKRQRDADEHRQAMESLRGVREEYGAKLSKLNETLEALGPKKPDPELRRRNPGEYAAQKAEYEEYQEELKKVGAEQGTVDEDRQNELLEIRSQIVAQEREKLFDAVPEWGKDVSKAQSELADLAQFAIQTYGFTQEQLDSVVDHRLLLMLRENKQARDRRKKGKEKLEGKKQKTRRLQPGSRTRAKKGGPKNKAQRIRQKLAREGGSLRAHARLLELESGDDFL